MDATGRMAAEFRKFRTCGGICYRINQSLLQPGSPPSTRRGGRGLKKNVAKQPSWERTGWFVELPIIGGGTNVKSATPILQENHTKPFGLIA